MITSNNNAKVKQVVQWQTKAKERRKDHVFLAEGVRMCEEAPVKNVREVYLTEELEQKIRQNAQNGDAAFWDKLQQTDYETVSTEVFAKMADTQTPQGVVFLCKGKSLDPPEELEGDRFLVLDGVQDPGNVGAIWRSADAFGADGLILCGPCADPWSPKTVRATMGAVFRLPVWETTLEELAACLERKGIPLYSTALREDTVDVRQIDLSQAAVIVGSEGRGVSPLALELCEKTIKIPMRARCESLNAGVAASVVLWEMARSGPF